MKNIIEFNSYIEFIVYKSEQNRGEKTKIALACGCEKSYLSKVLKREIHLTTDHGYLLCEYFQFNDLESEYFMNLLDLERSGSAKVKEHLRTKIKKLKNEFEQKQRAGQRHLAAPSSVELIYNSSWLFSAINFITAITKYQHVDDIAARLMIPKETVLDVLTQLENFGFVKKINQRWIYQSGAAHTEAHSPLVNLFHTGWRNRAMVDMQKISGSGVHYSNVQAVEKKLFEEMKTELSQLIHRFSVLADRSASEELICLNVDLFEV